MNEVFRLRWTNRIVRCQYRLNRDILKVNQVSFGNKSIKPLGPKIQNCLPPHKKSCENFKTMKRVIKTAMALLVTVEYAKTSHLKCSKNIQKLF